ncbi:hypothetical protein PGTUg99_030131 [Puccinia graminis f. sp. tritici]|uniref:Uncharacterized protein n=1 Tax=Puccinia graminis f. sp. tritici TaxID=56615 RepID=A0A5B0R8W2_PUCGR|nr:hypothetical protein PGTUg99_030131 [Puccinia graminis f. sp. tritici]
MILPSSSIQSYYAVMIVMVVRSVRLTESPVRHHDRAGASLVRRARGNEPPQTCESCFAIAGPDNFARCQNRDGHVFSCDARDCPGCESIHLQDLLPSMTI